MSSPVAENKEKLEDSVPQEIAYQTSPEEITFQTLHQENVQLKDGNYRNNSI